MRKVLLIYAFLWFGFSSTVLADTRVLVNPSVSQIQLDVQTLSRIYAMQLKSWKNGQAIKVYILPPRHSTHRKFVLSKLKMQPHQLDRLWNRLVFTGTGRMPFIVENEQAMLQKIKNTPGAIGYIHSAPLIDGVKVVVVGGAK